MLRLVAKLGALYLLATLGLVMAAGCPSTAALRQPDAAFVNATRLIHGTIATEYVAYVQADASLTPAQKQNRVDALADFEFMLRTAEANVAGREIRPTVPAPREEGGGDDE